MENNLKRFKQLELVESLLIACIFLFIGFGNLILNVKIMIAFPLWGIIILTFITIGSYHLGKSIAIISNMK